MTEHPHYVTCFGLAGPAVNSSLRYNHFEGSPCIPPQHVLGPCEAFHFFFLVSNFFYASLAMQTNGINDINTELRWLHCGLPYIMKAYMWSSHFY